ncbi:MAG: hypothetical protein PUG54_05685 [Firmicutes bacterium]|nr:hypothetical protein [Bacillota bacterium]
MGNMITGNYNYMNTYSNGYAGSYMSITQSNATSQSGKAVVNPGESTKVSPGRKSSPAECETCKNRKYQDGSDEMVSFKSAAHISPEASAARVMAHEQEHVSNAYTKAAKNGGKVLSANVTLKTAICPECGRSYVAGGTTATRIQYSNENNPYVQNRKSADAASLVGRMMDMAV